MAEEKEIPTERVPPATVPKDRLPTEQEEKEIAESPIPQKWVNLNIPSFIERGWNYRVKTKVDGSQYMCLRKGSHDKGLGRYTPSKEKLLFHLYPELREDFMRREHAKDRRAITRRKKPYISVPITKVAVIPRDYRPSLSVVRYFHIFKKNGFPGDFSEFINGNVEDHFIRCNGIVLPVLLEELQEKRLIENVQ